MKILVDHEIQWEYRQPVVIFSYYRHRKRTAWRLRQQGGLLPMSGNSSRADFDIQDDIKKQKLDKADYKPLRFTNAPFEAEVGRQSVFRELQKIPFWRYTYTALLIVFDINAILLAMVLCFFVKPDAYRTVEMHIPIWEFILLMSAIWILSLLICNCYHRHMMSEGYDLYTKIFNASILTIVLSSCMVYMFDMELPRTSIIITPIVACVLEIISRWIMRRLLHSWRTEGRCRYKAIILGSPEGIDNMLETIDRSKASGYRPVAVCPIALDPDSDDGEVIGVPYHPSKQTQDAGIKTVAFNSHFPRTAERMDAQIIIIADVLNRDDKIMHSLPLAVESLGIEVALSISVADIGAHHLDLDYSGMQPILVASLPQYSGLTCFIKRTMDIIGSVIALIISIPLVIIPTAIAIKHEDRGPVFYKQKRIGLNGTSFDCYKFRSMCLNADKMDSQIAQSTGQNLGALFKVKEDPRVTKVGKFIRKYSIDEFPQFFNVLKGDMSLVGPRPQRAYEVATYGTLYSTRLLVKPGITGPWQISGRSDLNQAEAEQLDVSYIQQWSLTSDLAILAKTVFAVLKHNGSY